MSFYGWDCAIFRHKTDALGQKVSKIRLEFVGKTPSVGVATT